MQYMSVKSYFIQQYLLLPCHAQRAIEGVQRELARSMPSVAMAPHSSTLAWKIPWTEEPGRLQSMGSLRVRHD